MTYLWMKSQDDQGKNGNAGKKGIS